MSIRSILDNDLYKFSMANGVLRMFPNVHVSYKFTDRRSKGNWTQAALKELKRRIKAMAKLALTKEERQFCETRMPWINRTFWDFLAAYRYNPKQVHVYLDEKSTLHMDIKGLWCETIFWEVPLLALACEVYYEMIDTNWTEEGQEEKMFAKAQRLHEAGKRWGDNGAPWGDFGTRRRRHFAAQERVVRIGKQFPNFTGTSNVYLAMKYDVKAIGTMAHEWIMGHSALFSLEHANKYALENWNRVYQGNLGTALPDTFGTDAFLRDFDGVLARLFDSVRHDSGDPKVWAQKMIDHYSRPAIGVDWKTKPLGFTDGNTDESAIDMYNWVKERGGRCWFGIGTSFSNDYGPESPALSIVIKLYEVEVSEGRFKPVVKLSDNPEKASGDEDAVRVAKWVHLGIPLDAPRTGSPGAPVKH
jgi:nicotinate phosphoribosyltransferase